MLNRRQFIKALGICAAAATLPVSALGLIRKQKSHPLLSGELGHYEGIQFIESSSIGQAWNVNTLGGYMYRDDLAEELRKSLS